MEFFQDSWARVPGVLLILYAAHYVYCRLQLAISRHRTAKKEDCEPVKRWPGLNTFSNDVIGWKIPMLMFERIRARKALETQHEDFFKSCNTVQFKAWLTDITLTTEPENIKTVLSLNFNDWNLTTRRKWVFGSYIGHGIFSADGPKWKHTRELIRPNFARSQIDNPATMEPHVSTLLGAIPRDGSTFDLQDLFFRFSTAIAIELLFGYDQAMSRDSVPAFSEALDRIIWVSSRSSLLGKLGAAFKVFCRKDIDIVNGFLDHYIDLALKDRENYEKGRVKGERYVFLHELIERTQDYAQIRSESLNVLIAGKDTTAGFLSNTWFTLAKRPDIWDKLRAEVDDLNGEKPSYEALQGMKYLKAVLNESLRLYPVTPVFARMANTDTILPVGGGQDRRSSLLVQKDQVVGWSMYVMHRRKDIYGEDAEEFRPERWETLRPGWGYLPFSGGPRVCVGRQFALTEAAYATVRLMQEYRTLKSCDPQPWQERLGFTLSVGNGVKVSMTAK